MDDSSLEKSLLALIEFLLLSKRSIGEIAGKYKITLIQAMTLLLLSEPRPMNNFTQIYNCDASNTTGIIDGLENKQLVGRYELPGDRRVKMIKIKPKGSKIRKSLLAKLTDDDSFIAKRLSESELLTFIDLLRKIVA